MNIFCMYDELVKLKDLKPNPQNRNKHTDDDIKSMAHILKHVGWRSPIIVSKLSGLIVAGHKRLAAAKLNKWDSAPVVFQEYEDKEAEFIHQVEDNATGQRSELDLSGIHADLKELQPFDVELLGIDGFQFEPIFDPGSLEEQSRLDEKQPIECPHCGKSFVKN